ncbi:MAG: DUF3800 domain-containing protein [Gaiellaceae bacterium]
MLFFVDESWQTIGSQDVGALGAIGIATADYNAFSRAFYRLKQEVLGATELSDSEIRGQTAFTKAAFKRQDLHGDSYWLEAIDRLFQLLAQYHARTFGVWTTNTSYVSLRGGVHSAALSEPYKQLLFDFRAFMSREAAGRLGSLNFDQRQVKEDEFTACSLQNYLVRTGGGWGAHFLQIPNFTVSSVSPGLQSADVVAHLIAHLADQTVRSELRPFVDRVRGLRYSWQVGDRTLKTIRQVY